MFVRQSWCYEKCALVETGGSIKKLTGHFKFKVKK